MRNCSICKKGSVMAGKRKLLRGHYNLVWRGRKYPNLQWGRLASGQRAKMCAACLKKNSKTKAQKSK